MARFSQLVLTKTFDKAYAGLAQPIQKQCDKAIRFLIQNPSHNSLRFKPIEPAKKYWEASINMGDRLIIRPDGDVAYLMDVVTHDGISKYGGSR